MKSKQILALAALFFALTSCSSFYQIATISSYDAKMNDKGDFAHNCGDIVIHYDFWSSCGQTYFAIENNSEKDIDLDLTKSFFIKNGVAYDYFLNRATIYTNGISVAKGRTISESKLSSITGNVSGTGGILSPESSFKLLTGATSTEFGVSSSIGASNNLSTSNMAAAMKSNSVEYRESTLVTIPAHSTKIIGEYSIASGEFIKCGLVRNPSGRDNAIVTYDRENSPIVVENRLYFIIDGNGVPVNSTFYVSEFRNLPENKVIKTVNTTNCAGKSNGKQYINIFAASNRYFVKYSVSSNQETGRTK